MCPITVVVLNVVLLVCMWWIGDIEAIPKIIITVVYLLSLGLIFVPVEFVFAVGQCVMAFVLGFSAFGLDYFRRR